MMRAAKNLSDIIGWICRQIGALSLLLMVLLTMFDILTRFLFKVSNGSFGWYIKGAPEAVSFLMFLALFCAIITSIERAQAAVDVFTHRMPALWKNRLQGAFLWCYVLLGLFLARGFFESMKNAQEYGERTQDLTLPLAPMYFAAMVLCVLLTVRSTVIAIAFLKGELQMQEELNV